MGKGIFITLEGGEGSGKSTQSRNLSNALKKRGLLVRQVREPGGSLLGDRLRRLLKFAKFPITAEAELLLFNASRSHLVQEGIKPALDNGEVVICDRFVDSTIAYQGYGRCLPIHKVRQVNDLAVGDLEPDLTILLDITPIEGISRHSEKKDRFEFNYKTKEAMEFHDRVRRGYLELASKDPGRWLVLDARLKPSEITRLIFDKLEPLLETLNS